LYIDYSYTSIDPPCGGSYFYIHIYHYAKKISMKKRSARGRVAAGIAIAVLLFCSLIGAAQTGAIKNIVLVHGAFADGSGWEGVFKVLSARGYHVTVVQEPHTSLEDDVEAVNRVLARIDGPCVLVGHSYGGAVISQAGVSAKVAALVYVAAFAPDAGEPTIKWAMADPPAPENGIMAPDAAGFVYYDEAKFHAGFCADLSKEKAAFMFASQGAIAGKCFGTPLSAAAWKTKPSWAIVATEDKSINPNTERTMYKRANATVTELKGSHVIFIAQPKAVADIIEAAAKGAGTKG
jgi:pimeloyl-ACP methyl ester carboxylesterase